MKSALITTMLIFVLLTGDALAAGKVAVVTGVLEDQAIEGSGLKVFTDAIKEALKNENIQAEFIYSNVNETVGETVLAEEINKTLATIESMKPDAIILSNDYSIRYLVPKIDDIPIVVAYFFSQPQTLGLPKANVTGITRGSYAEDMWRMANQLTGGTTVGMLSKKSFSMEQIRKVMFMRAKGLEQSSGVKFTDMYLCDTYAEWQDKVKNWSEDLMYLIDTSRLTDGEREVMPEETTKWTLENVKVPFFSANDYDVRYGALFSIVTSDKSWGLQAVEMVKKIIAGTPVSDIPMETVTKGKLLINAKTAEKFKVEIPYEILETAEEVYE